MKLLGIIFITVSVLMMLAAFNQIAAVLAAFYGLSSVFTKNLSSEQIGFVVGNALYWAGYLAVMFIFFICRNQIVVPQEKEKIIRLFFCF